VQKNGSLAGYRWGVKRKAALLEKEAASQTELRKVGEPKIKSQKLGASS
jgi:hypothetical protein